MKLKQRTLSLNNVVSYTVDVQDGDEVLGIVDRVADHFRQILVHNGYYTTAPMVFRGLPNARQITLMTTLGNRVDLVGSRDSGFEFHERVEIQTDFFYRHFDVEEPVPYAEIEEAVVQAGSCVVNIVHVILDFYGEAVLDLYVEAEKQ